MRAMEHPERAGQVCLRAGEESCKRFGKLVSRADVRLIYTTQTAWERSKNIIRRSQVHDLFSAVSFDK
jgi:hypothetical protein